MLALDHIVIAAKAPKTSAMEFSEKHHVIVVEGGKHKNWGTYNYLAYFGNQCYIEWLGIYDEEIARKSDNPLIEQLVDAYEKNFEGPIQYALRTEQMDDYLNYFNALNLSYVGPIPGSRNKPDGTGLKWRMLFPKASTPTPFLIEWEKEKNLPSDKNLINSQLIHTIYSSSLDEDIFKLPLENHTARLENALLITGNIFGFQIKKTITLPKK
ncbi:VOC family protein [Oceanobacillus bengalensis]|nr:VOC family protein [Oceanobacillus bengalensis]